MTNDGDPGRSIQPQRRDDGGLMRHQRSLLQELAQNLDFRDACKKVDVKPATAMKWLKQDPAFQAAYDELLNPVLEIARDLIQSTAIKASDVQDAALTATKGVEIEVKCPHCEKNSTIQAGVPDWPTRLRAIEQVLKVSNILIDRREIASIHAELSAEEMIAALAYRAGRDLPPGLYKRLEEKGALK